VLKYRLYDIDVVISRTLVYGSLAALITAVYVGIVVGVGTLIGSGGQPNLALSIVATAIVAVAFQPVRERLQKIANRLVYGKRATPYEVLSEFSERVAESYAANDVLPRMARVLAEGTGAVRADVWLRAGQLLRPAASWPEGPLAAEPALIGGDSVPGMPEADRVVEVRHQGELLGALSVTKRAGESLNAGRGEAAGRPRLTGGIGPEKRGAHQRVAGAARGPARIAAAPGGGRRTRSGVDSNATSTTAPSRTWSH